MAGHLVSISVLTQSFGLIPIEYYITSRYLLATCTFTPLYGRLCNVMGRRGANHSAVLFATFGILACGLSGNMKTLILSRFVRILFRVLSLKTFFPRIDIGNGWRRNLHHLCVRFFYASPFNYMSAKLDVRRIITSDMYGMRVSILTANLQHAEERSPL